MPEMISLDNTGYLVMVRVYDEDEFKAEWYATLPEAVARQTEVETTTGELSDITTPYNRLRGLLSGVQHTGFDTMPYPAEAYRIIGQRGAPGTECPTGWDPSEDTNA